MKAIPRELRTGRLPVNLLRHLLDVVAEQGFEDCEELRIAPETIEVRPGPREPVGLNHISLAKVLFGENLVRQVAVAIRHGMFDSLFVKRFGLELKFGDLVWIKKTSDY